MTPSLKTWWQGLKYWQKGAIIGFGVGILYFVMALTLAEINQYYNYELNLDLISSIIIYTIGLPLVITAKIYQLYPDWSDAYIPIVWLISLFVYALIGALIGLIIGKVKGR